MERVTTLPPDIQVLLRAVRIDETPAADAGDLFHAIINWQALLTESLGMDLLPLLYRLIKSQEKGIVPNDVKQSIENHYLSGVARNLVLSNELIKLLDLFKKEGIAVMPFKGPVLAVQAYNDIAMRQFSDLDIMILSRDSNKVLEILSDNHFIPSFNPKTWDYIRSTRRDFNVTGRGITIDFHQQVAKGPAFFRLQPEMWESASVIRLNTKNVTTFSTADTLVFLCIHCAKDGFLSLKRFRDIAGIIRLNPGIDWDAVYRRASAMKSTRILEVGLSMSQRLCGVKLPHFIANRISNNETTNSLFNFFLNRLLANRCKLQHLLTWYLTIPEALDTKWSKLKYYFWFAVCPSPQVHGPLFKLPASLYFLFPVIHPIYLLFRYGKQFFHTKQKEKISGHC